MTDNDANRLVTYNGQKVIYDEKRNMTYGLVDGVMQELTYDYRNRLVEAGRVVVILMMRKIPVSPQQKTDLQQNMSQTPEEA